MEDSICLYLVDFGINFSLRIKNTCVIEATAFMPAPGYIFVPNDGGIEKPLNAAEVKSFKHLDDHDTLMQTRFSDLLHQRNINVPFWLSDKGVMIYGSSAQARAVSGIVEDLPRLAPAKYAVSNHAPADNDNKLHISAAFDSAAERYKFVRPSPAFNAAADDAPKMRSMASRPSIRGNYGTQALAA